MCFDLGARLLSTELWSLCHCLLRCWLAYLPARMGDLAVAKPNYIPASHAWFAGSAMKDTFHGVHHEHPGVGTLTEPSGYIFHGVLLTFENQDPKGQVVVCFCLVTQTKHYDSPRIPVT